LHTMQPAMVDRLFAAMPEIESMHGFDGETPQRRNFGLFGGEPLLAAHRDIVTYIMERGAALGEADFWAITNATELEAYRDVLGPGKLSRLQITLDGPSREHDQRRIYADGSPSFARIAANINMALELGTTVSIRLNIDRNNIGDLPELVDEIKRFGWHEKPNFSVYTAPIHASNEATDRKTTMNSWQLDQALTEMRETHPETWIIGRPDETIRTRARQIFEGKDDPIPQFRPSFCSAHDQMYIFDAFGDVYACWERTGDAKIRIAHVTAESKLELTHEINREWRTRSVASNPVCRRCRYSLHCGGGCAILALGQRGKFHSNYCDGFASRFRASVADAYRAYAAGELATPLHEQVCDL
ncbi:MAG: SPASM domain-containing protein, partial [Acidobacteriota bacterium]